MSPTASTPSTAPFLKSAQTDNLFDFPTPPAQPPSHVRHSMLTIPDSHKRASRRLSLVDLGIPSHPDPAGRLAADLKADTGVDTDLVTSDATSEISDADTDESDDHQDRPESGKYIANFKKLSKSTTSLPAMLSGYSFGINDDLHLGDYQYYPCEKSLMVTSGKPAEADLSQQAPPLYPPLRERSSRFLRAAKSHHNLQTPEDNCILSQSMLSMASKVEPLLEVVDLLSPIQCGSYEYDACRSLDALATASGAHVEPDTPASETHTATGMLDLDVDVTSGGLQGAARLSKEERHSRENHAGDVLQSDGLGFLIAEPMEASTALGDQMRNGDSNSNSSFMQTRAPALMPRKQISMAELEARCRNRNSMLVSGTLLPAISPEVSNELSRHSRFQRDEADVQLDKRLRRASRYLYDVPSGGSLGNGMQGTLSKAFNWPQRIGRSSSKRAEKTKSTVIDQYKIYDIYEESIWHSTHTAGAGIDIPGSYSHGHNFGFGLGSGSGGNSGATDHFATSSKPSAISLSGLKTLRSVASSPGLLRLRMAKSQKFSTKHRKREIGNWNRSDTVYGSEYSDSDTDSDSDSSVMLSEAHKQSYPKTAPVRKSSSIHLFVKKASLSLIRRSVSFCKSVGGAGKSLSTTPSTHDSVHFKSEGFDGVMDMRGRCPEKVVKPKRSHRFATAVRHAGSRLKGTLRSADKKQLAVDEDDSDVVSAYPTDSMPRCDLDSYLSRSAHHSPSMTTPTNSTTVCDDDGIDTDDDSEGTGSNACAKAGKQHQAKYVPPKRPPFLGLHRKSIVGDIGGSGDVGHSKNWSVDSTVNSTSSTSTNIGNISNADAGPSGESNGSSFVTASSVPARLRPTQFNSAFTTLPYGAYAQMSQSRSQHYPFNGHM
ncbi:hypothetical protein FB645_002246 [Coemansia sp. IMI 203386]|nr:hypothetical protein FB645_002246 [Coemansia sp. IMI 203386]